MASALWANGFQVGEQIKGVSLGSLRKAWGRTHWGLATLPSLILHHEFFWKAVRSPPLLEAGRGNTFRADPNALGGHSRTRDSGEEVWGLSIQEFFTELGLSGAGERSGGAQPLLLEGGFPKEDSSERPLSGSLMPEPADPFRWMQARSIQV